MKLIVTAAICCLLAAAPYTSVSADVVAAADNGFQIKRKIGIKAPPEIVWRSLIAHVGEWWSDAHTFSGNAHNLYMEATALGCFCERIGSDGSVVHLTVTFVNPSQMIRLTGGLGPLGLMGVDGNMTISLRPGDNFTTLELEYQVGGYTPNGLESIAPAVDAVLGEQIGRLREFVETGSVGP